MTIPRILAIAGSDSGGGAGIQADIKTITMLGGYAMTAVTAITAQNTCGVSDIMAVPGHMVVAQIDAVLSDIGADAVKIGMIGSADVAHALADLADRLPPIVFDPVMIATSGTRLADEATIRCFERLMPHAYLVTPNAPELALLAGTTVETVDDMERAARALARHYGVSILAKGGHVPGPAITDILVHPDGSIDRWSDIRLVTRHTHGTGCTLSSAIATGLASGSTLRNAVERGRQFVRAAMHAAPGLGAGAGPMGHGLGLDHFH